MSSLNNEQRKTGAMAMIAIAVTVGGWMAFVDPARHPLAAARVENAAAEREARDAEKYGRDIAKSMADLSAAQAAEASLRARVAGAPDPASVLGGLSALAERAGVRIDSVTPAEATAKRAPTKSVPKPAGTPEAAAEAAGSQDVAFGFQLNVSGSYFAVADFLNAVEQELGVSSVRAVRVQSSPVRGQTAVNAEVRVESLVPAFGTQGSKSAQAAAAAAETENLR